MVVSFPDSALPDARNYDGRIKRMNFSAQVRVQFSFVAYFRS